MIFASKSFSVAAAQAAENRAKLYCDYVLARGEARACGYQFPSFNEWCNGNTRNDGVHRATLAQQLFDDYGYVD